jgi:hypothetical protein
MMHTNTNTSASANFERRIQGNRYPGRGLVVGRSAAEDAWYILYWIMGRSENSRNRRFVVDGVVLRTEPVDLSRVADPSLIIYEAMLELPGRYLVSNGDQTRTLYETLQAGGSFDEALEQREREPDAPHYTPRISALLDVRAATPAVTLSILKASLLDPAFTDRYTFRTTVLPGFGVGLTTYAGDGNPLPSFSGDPLLLPLTGSAEEVLDAYWNALDSENRISLALKRVEGSTGCSTMLIRNRFAE